MPDEVHLGESNDPIPPQPRPRLSRTVPLTLWVVGLIAGTLVMNGYSLRPGAAAQAPVRWPEGTSLERALDQPTVVMAVHPRCPCTRASIEELSRLAARIGSRARIIVLGFDPGEPGNTWLEGDLWESANAIPRVLCVRDAGGAEIRRFGIETSGQVLLYDSAGVLLFRGGITISRGQSGDNRGRAAIEEWVADGRSATTATPVFGCEFGLTPAVSTAPEGTGKP